MITAARRRGRDGVSVGQVCVFACALERRISNDSSRCVCVCLCMCVCLCRYVHVWFSVRKHTREEVCQKQVKMHMMVVSKCVLMCGKIKKFKCGILKRGISTDLDGVVIDDVHLVLRHICESTLRRKTCVQMAPWM